MREMILQLATQAKRKIAVAESCTGGMLAAALTDLPGSSAIFERGFVTYSNAAKIELLGVSADTLARHGAVSEPVAKAMARGALDRSGGDIALSITGIAGPGGSDHKPEGRVCFGLALSGGAVTSETIEFGAKGRDAVRIAARDYAMGMLLEALKQN
ncbi:MAG: CinA family protein [Paracoccaceae bacterium]